MINPSLLIIKHQRYNTQNESDEIETGFFFFKFIFLFLTNKKSQTLKQKLKKSTELDSWVEWNKVLKNPQSLFLNITKTVSYLKKDKRERRQTSSAVIIALICWTPRNWNQKKKNHQYETKAMKKKKNSKVTSKLRTMALSRPRMVEG